MQYGLVGKKLAHSFSKELHNRLFDYQYDLVELSAEEFGEFMQKRDFKGINVTIPYKQDVIPYLDFVSKQAEAIGAVNTVVNKDGKLYGYNTDFAGMRALFEKNGIEINGKKVLILGSGGTSKTADYVAKSLGAAEIYRVSRTGRDGGITYEQAYENHTDAQIIINTTPCGMYPNAGERPIDISHFENLCGVVDAIYNPLRSQLVLDASARGIPACGGLYMLIAQGVFAAEHFLDIKTEKALIDDVFSQILLEKENLVLIGMPGSGKSTVGRILAEKLNMKYVDTDDLIKKSEGYKISEIFKRVGESGFRELEASAVADAAAKAHCVIATGGGAILKEKNISALKSNGRIYFLNRPLELIAATNDRPLSSNRADLEKRFRERYDIYCRVADKIIDNSADALSAANMIKEDFCL